MAQIAAIVKGLYYPTDERVINLFVEKHLRVNCLKFTAYDPCSGEGLALKAFIDALPGKYGRDIDTVGTEIEENRAEAGKANLTKSIHASFESCRFKGHPDFIWMNPPYDDIGNRRVEIIWIDRVAPQLPNGRCMLLVIPQRFMPGYENYEDLRLCLSRNRLKLVDTGMHPHMQQVGAFRFPQPEFELFKQYILVVEKSYNNVNPYEITIEGDIGEVDVEFTITTNFVSTVYNRHSPETKKSFFSVSIIDEEMVDTSISDERLIEFFGEVDNEVPVTPLQPMIDEILAAVIAGGMFSGVRIGESVVRGGIEVVVETKEVQGFHKTETYETEVMKALISELHMQTGEIESYNSDSSMFGTRIEQIARIARDIMHEKSPSIYQETDIERLSRKFATVHAPKVIRGKQNGLFPAQIRAASMVLRCWEETKSAILLGKMGTGKTITSIAAAIGLVLPRKWDAQKIVVLLPAKNDLVTKWKDEIAKSCRDLKPKIFDVETISETQKAFEQPGLTFIVVKESMLKRTSGWEEFYPKRMEKEFGDGEHKHIREGRRRCFNCGTDLELRNKNGNQSERVHENIYCKNCKVKFTTDVRNQNKRAYASLARYINKHYAGSYVLIMDEAHQFKGGDTARGYASANLIGGAYKVLAMTGTFYNGLASSMFHTLYRTQHSFRELYTHDGVEEYVEAYGLTEKKTTHYDSDTRSKMGYKKDPVNVKEIPGIHPSMIAQMLGYTIFMKIEDFGTPAYDKREYTLFLDLPKEPEKKITKYLSDIKDQAIEDMKSKEDKNMSLMSALTWAKRAVYDVYPSGDRVARNGRYEEEDREDQDGTIHKKNQTKVFTLAPIQEKKMTPKEEALLRLNQYWLARGYPILVYYLQTERRPVHERLTKWYNEWGMKIEYMPAGVSEKLPFIKRALRQGANAILCNPNLVREGIDLLQFGAIVWYGVTDDAVLVDQANARIYRPLIQDHEVSVYYLGYKGTYQSERWDVTAQKIAAMSAVHGDVRKGLAALLGDQSMIATVQEYLIQYEKKDGTMKLDDLPDLEKYVAPSPIDSITGLFDWGMLPELPPVPVDAKPDELINLDMFGLLG